MMCFLSRDDRRWECAFECELVFALAEMDAGSVPGSVERRRLLQPVDNQKTVVGIAATEPIQMPSNIAIARSHQPSLSKGRSFRPSVLSETG
jgi:hypothetical protein